MRSVLLLVAACGYPPLPGGGDDAHHGDGPHGDGPGSSCLAPSSYGSPAPTSQASQFFAMTGQEPEDLEYVGEIKNGSPGDYMAIGLVANTAEYPGNHISTGSGALSTTPDFASCGACVMILVKCPDPNAAVSHPAAFYMANSGSLSITSVNNTETGTLSNATFVHVSIDSNTGATAIINDGCTTRIDSVSFSASIQNG